MDSIIGIPLTPECMLVVNGMPVTMDIPFDCDDLGVNDLNILLIKPNCGLPDTLYKCIKTVVILDTFPKESTWEHNVPAVLDTIGRAAGVSHIYVAMNYKDASGAVYSSLCYEWADSRVPSHIKNPLLQHVPLRQAGFARWETYLSRGLPLYGKTSDFPQEEQKFLEKVGVIAAAIMPIFVDSQWWGFIMFDESLSERNWTSTELEALQTTANIFGSAESRARTEQKIISPQQTLKLLH